jgi:hypothetical protein
MSANLPPNDHLVAIPASAFAYASIADLIRETVVPAQAQAAIKCLSICKCDRQYAAGRPHCGCDHRLKAAHLVVVALGTVRVAKLAKVIPAKQARRVMLKTARALRAMEAIFPFEDVRRVRTMAEQIADTLQVHRSGGKRNPGREAAVRQAHVLLTMFGKRPLGCTPAGPWHRLARILYAAEGAPDLLPTMKKLHGELSLKPEADVRKLSAGVGQTEQK